MTPKQEEALAQSNFCPRCGKRLGTNDWELHSCTPPQRTWVGLTDEEIEYAFRTNSVMVDDGNAYMVAGKRAVNIAQAIEAKLKEKNT